MSTITTPEPNYLLGRIVIYKQDNVIQATISHITVNGRIMLSNGGGYSSLDELLQYYYVEGLGFTK